MFEGRAVGALAANCYLFSCSETKKAMVVDPGADGKMIYHWILERGLKVEYILLTHGHMDHIGGVDELRELLGDVVVGIHTNDAEMLTDGRKNLSTYLGPGMAFKQADLLLSDGQELMVGKEPIKVIATPGHSPGSVCFLCSEGLISGDTLFAGSIGRTDFPGGSMNQLLDGVKKKLLILPDATKVFPGHGEETSIGEEKQSNPFLS